jgi:hypothetical protein
MINSKLKLYHYSREKEYHCWDNKTDRLRLWGELRFRYEIQDNFTSQYYGNKSTLNNVRDPPTPFFSAEFGRFYLYPFRFPHSFGGGQFADCRGSSLSEDDYYDGEFGKINDMDREYPEPYNCYLQFTDPFFKYYH